MTRRDQLLCAAQSFAVMALAFPPLFIAADWLRYGG
jgi:hypothetical protein